MNGDEQKQALAAIKMMIGARANSQSAIGADTVKGYLIAVSDCTLWGIEQAATAFIKGNVADYDFDYFPPSAPRLAIEARKWDDAQAKLGAIRKSRETERIVSYPIGTLPPPPLEPLGPIKIEINGVPTNVAHLTYAEKLEAIRTGQLPDALPAPERIPVPRLKRV